MNAIYMSPAGLSEHLGGVAEKTLANWRCAGEGPAYFKAGGLVRYKLEDVEVWLEQGRVEAVQGR